MASRFDRALETWRLRATILILMAGLFAACDSGTAPVQFVGRYELMTYDDNPLPVTVDVGSMLFRGYLVLRADKTFYWWTARTRENGELPNVTVAYDGSFDDMTTASTGAIPLFPRLRTTTYGATPGMHQVLSPSVRWQASISGSDITLVAEGHTYQFRR